MRIVGLEEVLLASGDNLLEVSLYIRKILTGKANELEANMGNIQFIFRYHLNRADDFWFEAGANRRITLRHIFGSPMRENNGAEFYRVGFNLT